MPATQRMSPLPGSAPTTRPLPGPVPTAPPRSGRRRRLAVLGVITGLLVAASCTSSSSDGSTSTSTTSPPTTAPSQEVPGASWERVEPASVGLDAEALDQSARDAEAGRSQCLVVVRDGAIAGEWNFDGATPDTTRNVFSVTKSITSILVGIAQDDGDLSLDDPAAEWIPEWRDSPAAAVTVRDLVSMDSGREWSLAIDYTQLIRSEDQTAFAIDLDQQHAPGELWAYNNAGVQTLARVLEEATGQPVADFAQQRLFEPLGMTHTRMTVDASGTAFMYQGAQSTCEDLARFGLLLLHQGRWGDTQIVSSEYVTQATAESSTELNVGYGYLFWLNHKGQIATPLVASGIGAPADAETADSQVVPGAPTSLFWAIGLGNQLVQVDPDTGTVVVRLGATADPSPPTFAPEDAAKIVTDAVTD